jgi:hypothetical protein
MISNGIQLAKNLHRRMGYPLGKLQSALERNWNDLNGVAGPMRHVRRLTFKARHLPEVMERKRKANDVLRDLKPGIAACAQEFREKGFAYITDQTDATLRAELLKFYEEVITERSKTAVGSPTHPFFFDLDEPGDFATDHILLRFALQDSVVQAVTAAFGSVPILSSICINESRNVKIDTKKQRASQQWHLDYSQNGDEFIAVWVYLTDVPGLAQGPLTIIPADISREATRKLHLGRIEDEEITAAGLDPHVQQVVGPRATVFMVSTQRCYHMGSRVHPGEKRVMCQFVFSKSGDHQNFIKVTTPVDETRKLLICR